MDTFSNWLVKEELGGKELDAVFANLEKEISGYFDQLYAAIKRTYGSGTFDNRIRRDLIADLSKMIQRLQGTPAAGPTAAKQKKMMDWVVAEANGVVSVLKPVRTNPESGLPQFQVGDVLDNIKKQILGKVRQVRDQIVNNQVGAIGKDVQGLRKDVGGVRSDISQGFGDARTRAAAGVKGLYKGIQRTGQDVAGIKDTLKAPPLNGKESEAADVITSKLEDLKSHIEDATRDDAVLVLVAPDKTTVVPGKEGWESALLGNRSYNLQVVSRSNSFKPVSHPFNITNLNSYENARNMILSKLDVTQLPPEIAGKKNIRGRKVRDVKSGAQIKQDNRPRLPGG
jgi:hypothetical protein